MGPVTMGMFQEGEPHPLSAMACSMAFFWADEPSPFSVPVPQSAVLALPLALGEPLEEAVVLLLEPQPARASVPTRATPVTLTSRRRDWIFTIWSLSTAGKNPACVCARRDEDMEAE